MKSKLEIHTKILLEELGIPFEEEYRFDTKRRFRFDFAYVKEKVAVEAEGGTWMGKGHSGGKHYRSDCEKYNLATLKDWKVYRFTTDMVEDGTLTETMKKILL
jgi:very-short-patch-repair endonuclease